MSPLLLGFLGHVLRGLVKLFLAGFKIDIASMKDGAPPRRESRQERDLARAPTGYVLPTSL